jgi:tetratricopeptide (TPR) repeat protein/predicted aspartyl protease
MHGLEPIVTAKVNGMEARFVADSGAFFSTLSEPAAKRLKLHSGATPFGLRVRGAVGDTPAEVGVADDFSLAEINLHKVDFLVAGDFGGEFDGLLGQNILGNFDVEFDLANGVIRLFQTDGCGDAMLAYWAAGDPAVGMLSIESVTRQEPHIRGEAKVNGHAIRVLFDTGAPTSSLKLATAQRLGLSLADAGVSAADVYHGIGPRAVDSWLVPISSFEVGGESISNTRLRVARADFLAGDMLLGADFFLSHRVFVSYRRRRMFFAYNGGPVFRLEEGADRAPVSTQIAALSSAARPPAAADAAELIRLGAAAAARRNFPQAIDDFTRAIALQPSAAGTYLDRAQARLAAGQPEPAIADLDQALKLKPDDADVLLLRGVLRGEAHQPAAAEEDLRAALAAAAPTSDIPLRVAEYYGHAGEHEKAVRQFDVWLAAHPDDSAALNGRCWTRMLWGRGLDAALADCNRAISHGYKVAAVLDSRGYVHLRRGEFDPAIADFDAALKLQPSTASSLYGRGLARLKKGDQSGGQADVAAGAVAGPGIVAELKHYGLDEQGVVVAIAAAKP